MMRVGRCDLAPIVRAPTVIRNDDSKDGFLQGIREVFNLFPMYHMQILLGCCKAKYGREDLFKLTTGEYTVCIHQTPEKMCEYKGQ